LALTQLAVERGPDRSCSAIFLITKAQETIMNEPTIGLYPVELIISNGLAGAPTLHLNLLVNAPTGAITGTGRITQALAPPFGDLLIPSVSGQLEETGFPKAERLARVTGRYAIPFGPPPMIGHIDALMMMACTLDLQWNGKGGFSYGPHAAHTARNCSVRKAAAKASAETKVGTLDAVPA
jgi:Domain of unknown function (DUF1842)